jgi:peptide/nickel transport system substrate-binding protein
MTRTDTFVVGTLVVLLAIVAGLIGAPAFQPTALAPSASPDPGSGPVVEARPYTEGVLGAPVSVSPLTARTQVDRDLVALVFSGLVRNGPGGTIVPDLAERWTVSEDGGTWQVTLRDDVVWHDGEPLTSVDVAFTIRTLQDAAYSGPAAASWREVTVATPSTHTVEFTLATPLAGFLQALTQPIAPAHLLADVPVAELPEHPFGRQPVGSGPFALVEIDERGASLVPAALAAAAGPSAAPDPSAVPSDPLSSPRPTERPSRPVPYLPGIEFRFFTDPADIEAEYRAGSLDAASGITRALAQELARSGESRLLRYPGSTLTTVLLDLRAGELAFAKPAVRTALLAAIDRVAVIERAFAGAAGTATGPIPPTSPLFDAAADPPVAFDRAAAREALEKADWTEEDDGWHLPDEDDPLALEVLSPTQAANASLFAAAEQVVADWRAIGLDAEHVALPPGEFVTERLATGDFQVAIVDVVIGLDPDLYPLLASSQTLTGGSNLSGLQDPDLDALLTEARKPGTEEARRTAYRKLQEALAAGRYLLPLAFADEVVVMRDTVEGPEIRQVSDPSDRFWDVLTWRLAADG